MPIKNFDNGLALWPQDLKLLRSKGIDTYPFVRREHQHLANRYVLRGVESGGAVPDVGRYISFAAEDGSPLEYLHPVDSIGVNGHHAVVLNTQLVRIDMLRTRHTYELIITRHTLVKVEGTVRPNPDSSVLFRGVHGRLELDLVGKDKSRAGYVLPTFFSAGGEPIVIPSRWHPVVLAVTKAINCVGCTHSHYARAPRPVVNNAPPPEAASVEAVRPNAEAVTVN